MEFVKTCVVKIKLFRIKIRLTTNIQRDSQNKVHHIAYKKKNNWIK